MRNRRFFTPSEEFYLIKLSTVWLALTLLPLVVKAVVTEAILGRAGAPAPGGAAGGHPGHSELLQ